MARVVVFKHQPNRLGDVYYWASRYDWRATITAMARCGMETDREWLIDRLLYIDDPIPGTDETALVSLKDSYNLRARLDRLASRVDPEIDGFTIRFEEEPVVIEDPRDLKPRPPIPNRQGKARPCACGCGEHTAGGVWKPGHDARFKSESKLVVEQTGDMDRLYYMLELGWWSRARARELLELGGYPIPDDLKD